MSRRARLHAPPQPPKTVRERRAAARTGRLEVQPGFDGKPFISRADDVILVAEAFLDELPPCAELDDEDILTLRGINRTVIYRLVDHDWDAQTYVGIRRGSPADT